ncbi:MAG: sensor histidine kinase [Phycisphaerales bacterium]
MRLVRIACLTAIVTTALSAALTALAIDMLPQSASWPTSAKLGLAAVIAVSVLAVAFIPFATKGDRAWTILRRALTQPNTAEGQFSALPPVTRRVLAPEVEAIERRVEEMRELRNSVRSLEVQNRVAHAAQRQLEGILHSLRDVVLVTDGFDELVMANEAAGQLFNFDPEGAANRPVADVVTCPEVVQYINETRESGNLATHRTVEVIIESHGRPRVFEVMLSCLPDHNESFAGVVTLMRDMTREKEISEMKTDFVSKASHELRTPLSSIKAYVEMLIDGEAPDEASRLDFYQIIQNEAERLGRLIDNMLNISRIEAGIIQVEWETVDLSELASDVVELTKPQAREKNITLNLKTNDACVVQGGSDLLRQAITNLVSNAIKYTPEGGRVTIATELADCNRSVLVSVSDTGLGIPPDALPKLFEKFYRIDNYKRVAKGTGLGLNLVKQIVETVHNGEIGVESQLGMGSRFWFIVPSERPS